MKLSSNILPLLLLLLVGGGLFIYKSFFSQEVFIETEEISREAQSAEQLYEEINTINFDRAFFTSAQVNSLSNFYVDPGNQVPGRDEPFRPIEGVSGPASIPLEFGSGEGENI